MVTDFIEQLDNSFNVVATLVTGSKFRSINQHWLEAFCPNVKRNTGKWVYGRYRWHAYSFNHETSMLGNEAFEAYQAQPVVPFYLYHEWDDNLFDCTTARWPDLRPLANDIYIFPHTFAWSFILTHEMSLNLGPYFALPPAADNTRG